MWMPPNQLFTDLFGHVVDVESSAFARDLRVHYDEQQKIAELFPKVRVVLRARRFGDLVSFFDCCGQERLVSLLAVPWTAAGRAKLRHDCAELREGIRLQILHNERCV